MAGCCNNILAFVANLCWGHSSNGMELFQHGSIALVIAVQRGLVEVCSPDG